MAYSKASSRVTNSSSQTRASTSDCAYRASTPSSTVALAPCSSSPTPSRAYAIAAGDHPDVTITSDSRTDHSSLALAFLFLSLMSPTICRHVPFPDSPDQTHDRPNRACIPVNSTVRSKNGSSPKPVNRQSHTGQHRTALFLDVANARVEEEAIGLTLRSVPWNRRCRGARSRRLTLAWHAFHGFDVGVAGFPWD